MSEKAKPEEFPSDTYRHVHIWEILDSQIPQSPVHNPRIGATNITFVLIKCKTCGIPQTIELDGHWSLEQLLKNHARVEHRE